MVTSVLWMFWMKGFGISMWFVFTVFRLRRMYEISHNFKTRYWNYIFVAVCLVPYLIFSTVALFGSFDRYKNGQHYCSLSKNRKISVWIVYSPYWLVIVGAMHSMRKQQDPLLATEFEYVAVILVIGLLHSVALLTGASNSISGRCFLTLTTCCTVFCYFWMHFGWPVYLCLFRPEEMDVESDNTSARLRTFQAFCNQGIRFSSSEGAIWQAFSVASEELTTYKDEIQKLESQKLVLENKIRELQMQVDPPN